MEEQGWEFRTHENRSRHRDIKIKHLEVTRREGATRTGSALRPASNNVRLRQLPVGAAAFMRMRYAPRNVRSEVACSTAAIAAFWRGKSRSCPMCRLDSEIGCPCPTSKARRSHQFIRMKRSYSTIITVSRKTPERIEQRVLGYDIEMLVGRRAAACSAARAPSLAQSRAGALRPKAPDLL